jgi:tripartite-type tricarboxylate transporter receptor subunit TctC
LQALGGIALTRLTRRAALGAAAASAVAAGALAEDKPLRIVLGVPPGASADTITRMVGEMMSKTLGRPVIVDNKTGAGGIVANMTVKSAAPDGNTLLMTPLATMVAFPHSYTRLDYDPFKDFAPVAHVASFQLAFGTGPKVAAKTLADYVVRAKNGWLIHRLLDAGGRKPAPLLWPAVCEDSRHRTDACTL